MPLRLSRAVATGAPPLPTVWRRSASGYAVARVQADLALMLVWMLSVARSPWTALGMILAAASARLQGTLLVLRMTPNLGLSF